MDFSLVKDDFVREDEVAQLEEVFEKMLAEMTIEEIEEMEKRGSDFDEPIFQTFNVKNVKKTDKVAIGKQDVAREAWGALTTSISDQ